MLGSQSRLRKKDYNEGTGLPGQDRKHRVLVTRIPTIPDGARPSKIHETSKKLFSRRYV